MAVTNVGIYVHCSRQLCMAEEHLSVFRLYFIIIQQGSIGVSKLMRRTFDVAFGFILFPELADVAVCHMLTAHRVGEYKPGSGFDFFSSCGRRGIARYPSSVFGGIALATAPAPALSIVNEYHTRGPVTDTLIPLAAIDDVIGVIVFFTVISIVEGAAGAAHTSASSVVGMVLAPFLIGGINGVVSSWLIKRNKRKRPCFFGFFSIFAFFVGLSDAVRKNILLCRKSAKSTAALWLFHEFAV